MGLLGDLIVRVGASIEGFESAMGTVSQRLSALDRDATKAFSGFDKIGDKLTGLGLGLSAALTAPIAALTVASGSAAAEMDSLVRGLTAVSGSSESANAQLVRLQEVAKLPGLGFKEAVQGSTNLQAAGFSATEAENALKGFGNALATVGKGKSDLDGVVLALGQIASKGKISAEEINQLAERVPQIRKIMQDAFGTADTEVLQKAHIGAQEFVNRVTTELLKLPPVTGGLRNDFENFSDKLNQTLSAIGTSLAPVISSAVSLLSSLLDKVQSGVQWFSQLPAPVQNAAIAFGAVLAAVGPVVLAVGGAITAFTTISAAVAPIAGILGVSAAAFSGIALAIPLVTAALAALGTWVYENWEPIKATIAQAWDGVTDIWHAVWDPIGSWLSGVWGGIGSALSTAWTGIATFAASIWDPIATFFSSIWDGVGGYFKAAWDGIKSVLSSVWDGIKSIATTVWSAITGAIGSFLEAAAKIPGVNKLINLDDAWSSAKKASEEIKNAGKATEDLKKKADAAGGSGKPIPKLAKSLGDAAKQAKETDDKTKPLITRFELLDEIGRKLEATHKAHVSALADAKLKLAELGDKVIEVIPPSDELNRSIQAIVTSMGDVSKHATPAVISALDSLKGTSADLDSAFKTLGITSATEYQKVADEATKAYNIIKGSGIATPTEENNAMLKMLKAQKDAMIANGQAIPKEMQAMLDKLGSSAENASTGVPKATGAFKTFGTEVSTVITNLAQGLVKDLFSGEGSFAEKGLKALQSLGEAVVAKFTEPFAKAATDLMSGAISDLMGGKGFGGIIDRVKEVGSTIAGVFGSSAGSAAGGVMTGPMEIPQGPGGVPGVPSGGGAGSSGAGGLGGAMGVANLVTGLATAVSSIFGNFQMAGMNKSLDIVVMHTLQTANDLANLRRDEWTREDHLMEKLDAIWQTIGVGFNNAYTRAGDIWNDVSSIDGNVFSVLRVSEDIRSDVGYIRSDVYDLTLRAKEQVDVVRQSTQLLAQVREGITSMVSSRRDLVIRIEGGGAAERQMANNILGQLQAQGAFI